MSKFACEKVNNITPYVPGEQPRGWEYIKLNTNENPYFVSRRAAEYITDDVIYNLKKYSDPQCGILVDAIARYYGVERGNVMVTNGSDEALAFCFQTYCANGVCYADVTYGFYDVFAAMYDCPAEHIPLKEDFTIDIDNYLGTGKTTIIANPNAQTGIALKVADIEKIAAENRQNIVIIDQAYADFSEGNVIPLIKKYDNLVVVNTFSKSRSLAGARVGYVIADKNLIDDLNKVRYSFHPYNVNTLSMLLAKGAIEDDAYFKSTVKKIIGTRSALESGLRKLSFDVLPSSANFVLARTVKKGGAELYSALKDKGILVRHFGDKRIEDFIRITVGTGEQTGVLLKALAEILEEK